METWEKMLRMNYLVKIFAEEMKKTSKIEKS